MLYRCCKIMVRLCHVFQNIYAKNCIRIVVAMLLMIYCFSFVIELFCQCSCPEDLAVYVKALDGCLLRIPPNSLSKVWTELIMFVKCMSKYYQGAYAIHMGSGQKIKLHALEKYLFTNILISKDFLFVTFLATPTLHFTFDQHSVL